MKKLLTILLTLFLFSSVYAEVRVVDKLEYRDGIAYAVGESEGFSGQLAITTLDGEIKTSYKDGKKLNKTRYVLKSGFLVKDLKITYNDYDQEIIKINYEGGKELDRTINKYHENKQLKTTKLYKPNSYLSNMHDPLNGYLVSQVSYYMNGSKKSILNFSKRSTYDKGKIVQKYFYENGQLKREDIYLDGKNTDCYIEWNGIGLPIKTNKCYFYSSHRNEILPGPVYRDSYKIYRTNFYLEKLILSHPYLSIWLIYLVIFLYATKISASKLKQKVTAPRLLLTTIFCSLLSIKYGNYIPSHIEIYTLLIIYIALLAHNLKSPDTDKRPLPSIWHMVLAVFTFGIVFSGHGYASILFLGMVWVVPCIIGIWILYGLFRLLKKR